MNHILNHTRTYNLKHHHEQGFKLGGGFMVQVF